MKRLRMVAIFASDLKSDGATGNGGGGSVVGRFRSRSVAGVDAGRAAPVLIVWENIALYQTIGVGDSMTTGNGSAIGCARSRAGRISSRKRRFLPSMLSRRFPSLRWCLPFSVSYAGPMLSSDREKTACAGARVSILFYPFTYYVDR